MAVIHDSARDVDVRHGVAIEQQLPMDVVEEKRCYGKCSNQQRKTCFTALLLPRVAGESRLGARDWRGLAQKLSRPLTISDCARTCFVINKDGAGQTTDSHRADKVSPDASTRGRPQTAHRSLRA